MAGSGHNSSLQQYLPLVAGLLFIALFVRLGMWQLDRANEKKALAEAFANPANVFTASTELTPGAFQEITASGSYLGERQILIDNVIVSSRLGYFVITPMELSPDAPLLLVNRGWIAKDSVRPGLPDIGLGNEKQTINGKAGHLPRVAIRPGEAFADKLGWPRIGVWPTPLEVAAEIGRDVLPYVLLLDPQQGQGFVRQWKPRESGTSTHYGYAFQWFAMAAAAAALTGWHLRQRRKNNAS